MDNSPSCSRGDDLVSFLYGEASERETRDFETHLSQCSSCQTEIASFGQVRKSIGAWRDEALRGFSSSPATVPARKRSATAALREFFDLSPLWLKGAVAFASLIFCLLVVLVVARLQTKERQVSEVLKPNAVYTEQDLLRMINEALAKRAAEETAVKNSQSIVLDEKSSRKNSNRSRSTAQLAKVRRPLSRAEREQLAADLRLLSTHDEEGPDLLGDRINQ
jgi:Putative zinc-finger